MHLRLNSLIISHLMVTAQMLILLIRLKAPFRHKPCSHCHQREPTATIPILLLGIHGFPSAIWDNKPGKLLCKNAVLCWLVSATVSVVTTTMFYIPVSGPHHHCTSERPISLDSWSHNSYTTTQTNSCTPFFFSSPYQPAYSASFPSVAAWVSLAFFFSIFERVFRM